MTLAAFSDYFLQCAIIVASMVAGICWVKSATVKIPNMTENLTWEGKGAFPDALAEQSRWNARAAWAAAVAAAFQVIVFIKTVPPWLTLGR
jgi:hypothetical protein